MRSDGPDDQGVHHKLPKIGIKIEFLSSLTFAIAFNRH